MEYLKPCPFCGAELLRSIRHGWFIHPENDCILATADSEYGPLWFDGEEKYIKEWNRRAENG